MNKIYIILVNYNGWKDTIECLESVLKSEYPHYQIIVVDNSSENQSIAGIVDWAEGRKDVVYDSNSRLKHLSRPPCTKPIDYVLYDRKVALSGGAEKLEAEKCRPIILIQAEENRGFAAGNNVGIQYALAKGDALYFWLLNNDTVIEPNALTEMVGKAEQYKLDGRKIGIIGSKLMFYDKPKIIQGVGATYNKLFSITNTIGLFESDHGQYDNEIVIEKIDIPIGASMFIFASFIKDVGLMCEDYFLYYEELDWVLRGKYKGWQNGYCWQAKVYHKEGRSIGTSSNPCEKSELADFYGLRSRLIFTKKFYPQYFLSVRIGFLVALVNRIRRGQLKRIRLVFNALLSKAKLVSPDQ